MMMDDDINKPNKPSDLNILDGTTSFQHRIDPDSDSSPDNGLACSQQENTSSFKAAADELFPVANSAAAVESQKSKDTPDSNNIVVSLNERDEQDHFLKTIGLQRQPIKRDGNCLFRASSYGIYETEEHHKDLRLQSTNYILINCDMFYEYFDNFNAEMPKLYQDGEHAGTGSIKALVLMLQRNIKVTHGGCNEAYYVRTDEYGDFTDGISPIHIIYSGIESHYDTAVKIKPEERLVVASKQSQGDKINFEENFKVEENLTFCEGTPVAWEDIDTDDATSSASQDSPGNRAVPITNQLKTDSKVSYLPSPPKYVMFATFAHITEDVTPYDDGTKSKKTLLYTKEMNKDIYRSLLRNKSQEYPYLKGDLMAVESSQQLADGLEAAFKQGRKEGATRMVFSLFGHGQRGWKNVFTGHLQFHQPNPIWSYLYRQVSYLEFPFEKPRALEMDVLMRYMQQKAVEYGIKDVHVLPFMCHTHLSGTALNVNTDSFHVHYSTSKDRPRGSIKPIRSELSTYQSNLQQRVITRLTHPDEIDHSGKDILKANIEKILPYEHPFEGDGYVLVPLQRDTQTVDDLVTSHVAQDAMDIGCNQDIVREVIRRRMVEIGEMFPNLESLIEEYYDLDSTEDTDDEDAVAGGPGGIGGSVSSGSNPALCVCVPNVNLGSNLHVTLFDEEENWLNGENME